MQVKSTKKIRKDSLEALVRTEMSDIQHGETSMSFVHVTDYQRGDMLIENVSSKALKMGHEASLL
jgi:hypothetical protein